MDNLEKTIRRIIKEESTLNTPTYNDMKSALKIINALSEINMEHHYTVRSPRLKKFLDDLSNMRVELYHEMSDASPDYKFAAGNNYKWKMIKKSKG